MTRGSTVITGVGLITPLGQNAPDTWHALLNERGIVDHARVPHLPAENRASCLAQCAAREALADAKWSRQLCEAEGTALVVATSKGPIENWLSASRVADSVLQSAMGNPFADGSFGLAAIADELAGEMNIRSGPRLTLSAACASGLHALVRAVMLLRSGEADRVLVVATEASVHPLFIGSFERLGVLPPAGVGCKPFDEHRCGFVLTEAAAAVCLERSEDAGENLWASVDRFALAGDAFHLTASAPTGRTLQRILRSVVADEPLDLLHAHATATLHNDPIELAALEAVLPGDAEPPLYSHKGALGHSLGASGLVSIVLNCMSHRTSQIPGNIQTLHPLATRLRISPNAISRPVQRSLTIAAGFGGSLAAVSLRSL